MADRPTQTDGDGGELRHRVFWVGLILALLGGQIVLMGVMTLLAISDRSFAVEPDYYQKGLHWDATAAQRRENARLAWSAEIELGDDVSVLGERTVTCTLTDSAKEAIGGATIELIAFSHARASQRTAATLAAAGNGAYQTTLRLRHDGLWEFRLVARRGEETFTHTETRDVRRPGGARSWQR